MISLQDVTVQHAVDSVQFVLVGGAGSRPEQIVSELDVYVSQLMPLHDVFVSVLGWYMRGRRYRGFGWFLKSFFCHHHRMYTLCLDIFCRIFVAVNHQLPVKVHIKHIFFVLSNQVDVQEVVRF